MIESRYYSTMQGFKLARYLCGGRGKVRWQAIDVVPSRDEGCSRLVLLPFSTTPPLADFPSRGETRTRPEFRPQNLAQSMYTGL